ncbi:MAG: zf-HC2 domain-containing protein [Gemmatimonadota bacterium]
MSDREVTHETLMRYLDGELPPEERRAVEARAEHSTELRRELTLYRALHEDLAGLSFDRRTARESVWGQVNRRLARPIGWLLLAAGTVAWLVYAVYTFVSSEAPPWEKLGTGAVVIGILILLASVIYERYREILTDPYRHVER